LSKCLFRWNGLHCASLDLVDPLADFFDPGNICAFNLRVERNQNLLGRARALLSG